MNVGKDFERAATRWLSRRGCGWTTYCERTNGSQWGTWGAGVHKGEARQRGHTDYTLVYNCKSPRTRRGQDRNSEVNVRENQKTPVQSTICTTGFSGEKLFCRCGRKVWWRFLWRVRTWFRWRRTNPLTLLSVLEKVEEKNYRQENEKMDEWREPSEWEALYGGTR